MSGRFLGPAVLLSFLIFHGTLKVRQQLRGETPLGFVSALASSSFDASSVKGSELLKMSLRDGDREFSTLGELVDGKPLTVVAFFESWCAPCQSELPQLEKLHQQHAERGLQLIGVYANSEDEAVQQMMKRMGVSFPVMRGVAEIAARAGVVAVPTTVVFDQKGNVQRATRGVDAGLGAFVEKTLASAGASGHG